jgi:outer membrane murein-binding lipoprotein Lpp
MRASRWEILGAWLRIWTPPRDVEIPPVPRRKVALLGVALVAAGVAGFVLVAPVIDRAKREDAASEQRRLAASRRAELARLRFDQRPHRARAVAAARLYDAGREDAAQTELLRHARASVTRDARARVASGEFEAGVRSVRCRTRRGGVTPRVRLSCFAVSTQTAQVAIGQEFFVAGSLRDGRYAWCHVNPPPGEGATGVGVSIPLSPACTG